VTARDRIILVVVAAIAAVAGCWMLLIQPQRKQAASLGTQVQALQGQLASAQSQVSQGLAARSQFASNYTQLAGLGEALPQDDDMPSLLYQIQSAASGARVAFHTLQLVPGSGGSSSSSSSSPSSGSSSSSSSGSSSSSSGASSGGSSSASSGGSSSGSGGSGSSASSLPPGAGMGAAGFPTDQFTFSFTGDFFHLSDFFGRLQKFVVAGDRHVTVSGRLLTVNAITLGPGPNGFPQITATVSATAYMAPASTGLLDGATAAGPAGTTATPAAPGTGAGVAPATITPSVR
jgi:hypothetical protein